MRDDIENLVNLNLFASSFMIKSNPTNESILSNVSLSDPGCSLLEESDTKFTNVCETRDGRFVGKFISDNVLNLSGREISKAEISLLSKGLKFVPTPTYLNQAVLKEKLEIFGWKLRLKWLFRDNESENPYNLFRKKSKFR